jgi:hypothetical protein
MVQGVLLFLIVGAVAWLLLALLRGGKESGKFPVARSESANSGIGEAVRYPGVSIRTYRNGCPAAEGLKGQRFSPEDAPSLPLAECIWSRCNCKYSHHVDRRAGNHDRRKMLGSEKEYPMSMGDDDQRGDRGRRTRDTLPEPKKTGSVA